MTGFGLLGGLGAGTPADNEARARELGAEVKGNLMEAGAIEEALARAADPAANNVPNEARAITLGAEIEAIAAAVESERQDTATRIALLTEARAERAAVLDRLRTQLAGLR